MTSTSTSSPRSRGIAGLDGLRGISIGLVLLAHMSALRRMQQLLESHGFARTGTLFTFDAGDLGVSVFFVISGFLITTLLLRPGGQENAKHLTQFYIRRLFRIFPPYYFYLMMVGLLWELHRVVMLRGAFIAAIFYFSNYYPYLLSLPGSSGWLVGHTWTLSLEEQFYLVWPVCLKVLGQRRSAYIGLVIIVLAPLSRVVTLHTFPSLAFDGQIFRMFHTRIDTIMAGCILALALHGATRDRMLRYARSGPLTLVSSGLLFACLLVDTRSLGFHLALGVTVEAICISHIVLYSVSNKDNVWGRVLSNRVLCHFGIISYSIYLWQQMFMSRNVNLLHGHYAFVPIMILLLAETSYWVVERASYRVRDRVLRMIPV
jgi:peptidoglycan/LPS O-acetylase OafA/YrhL